MHKNVKIIWQLTLIGSMIAFLDLIKINEN